MYVLSYMLSVQFPYNMVAYVMLEAAKAHEKNPGDTNYISASGICNLQGCPLVQLFGFPFFFFFFCFNNTHTFDLCILYRSVTEILYRNSALLVCVLCCGNLVDNFFIQKINLICCCQKLILLGKDFPSVLEW